MKLRVSLGVIVAATLIAGTAMGGANGNDECADATALTVPAGGMDSASGSTTGQTTDTEAGTCGTGTISAPGVWYSVTGTGNTMTASTCPGDGGAATYDTKISVYCGDCAAPAPPPSSNCCGANEGPGCDTDQCEAVVCSVDPFCCNNSWDGICAGEAMNFCAVCVSAGPMPNCVAGNDDGRACPNLQSRVRWCSELGTEYLILVHGFGTATGNFTVAVSDSNEPCTGAVDCDVPQQNLCDPGSVSDNGMPPCTPCAEGTAQPQAGQTACVTCEPGSAAGLGSDECEECLGGTFQPAPGASTCLPCPAGEISGSGATSCYGTAPVVSWRGLVLSILLLIGVAYLGLRRGSAVLKPAR